MEEKHCKWYDDEFCTNAKSPCVADYCPVVEYPELCKHREFDKDINVRSKDDEEIVKGLENWILHDCTAKPQDLTNALDLIHRLQGENAELQKQVDELTKKCAEIYWFKKYEQVEKDTAKEILENLYYAIDGGSFWLEETGRETDLVKAEDMLAYMRKKAEEYGVEVDE